MPFDASTMTPEQFADYVDFCAALFKLYQVGRPLKEIDDLKQNAAAALSVADPLQPLRTLDPTKHVGWDQWMLNISQLPAG